MLLTNFMKTININTPKIHCASCLNIIESTLNNLQGVEHAHANLALKQVSIKFDPKEINEQTILSELDKVGYPGTLVGVNHPQHEHHSITNKSDYHVAKVVSVFLFTIPLLLTMFINIPPSVQLVLASIVILSFGFPIHMDTFKQLVKGMLGMDALISIGTLAALIYSVVNLIMGRNEFFFEAGAAIIAFITLGRYLEDKSKASASQALRKLLEQQVTQVRIVNNGSEKIINVDQAKLNDLVLVKPGEKIPLDGIVVNGESEIIESLLTGESLPTLKKKGSLVYAGTVNTNGALTFKVTKLPGETMLNQIANAVKEAQSKKAPIQKIADKVAGKFVLAVLFIALLTAVGNYLLGVGEYEIFARALAVLVVSCPCALGLATPIAVVVASGKGASMGILYKDPQAFELSKRIDTVVFDKTGTLTKGEFDIDNIMLSGKVSLEEFGAIAAALEKNTTHPVGFAIYNHFNSKRSKKFILPTVSSFKEIPGTGVEGKINSKQYSIKKSPLSQSGTAVELFQSDTSLGTIILNDALKEESVQAIQVLNAKNIEVGIITGDNLVTAKAVANKLNPNFFFSGVLPHEKSNKIKELQAEGKVVAFAGDGINDAPALTQANLGLAMGTGSDIAKESGQIIITNSNPYNVYRALEFSRETYHIIKQNLFWAFAYNAVGIPLAAFGILPPIYASFAMAFSSVTVVANALRLKKAKA